MRRCIKKSQTLGQNYETHMSSFSRLFPVNFRLWFWRVFADESQKGVANRLLLQNRKMEWAESLPI